MKTKTETSSFSFNPKILLLSHVSVLSISMCWGPTRCSVCGRHYRGKKTSGRQDHLICQQSNGTVLFMSLDWVSLSPFSPPCIFKAFIVLFMNHYSFSIIFLPRLGHLSSHGPHTLPELSSENASLLLSEKKLNLSAQFSSFSFKFPLSLAEPWFPV